MSARKTKQVKSEKHLDKASLFFGVVALILIVTGFILNATDTEAVGITNPNRYGQGGGERIAITGTGVIVLGLFFALLPLKDLVLELKGRFAIKTGQEKE